MTKTHGAWLWYELMSPDPAGSKAFYETVIGWTMTLGTPETGDYGFIARADGGMTGGLLRLTKDMVDSGCKPFWLGYIGVENVDQAVAALEARGGKCLMPARDVPMAGRIAMVADPEGANYYVMTPTPPPGGGESTAFAATTLGSCGWNEMRVANQAGALDYYTGLYGWNLPEPMDMGAMGTYQFLEHDGTVIGAIMTKPAGTPESHQSHWIHYFRVASIEIATTAIAANGGKLTFGPQEVPGGDWIIHAMDPQGAEFSLVGGK